MSASAAPGDPGPRGGSLFATIQSALPWAVVLLIAILYLQVMYTRIELGDEGVVCMGALRVMQGEVPYRDFFEFITPLTFYALSFFYRILGPTFETGRVFALLVALGLVLLYYLIGRRLRLRPLYLAMGLSFCLYGGFEHWSIPSHHWLANLFMAVSVLFLLRSAGGGSGSSAAISGFFAGLTGMTLQDQGGVWFLLASALVFPFLECERRRRLFAFWAAGCLAVAALFALVLLPKTGFKELWFDWIVFPLTRYRGSEINESTLSGASLPIVGYWLSGSWRQRPFFSCIFTLCDLWSMLLMPLAILLLSMSLNRWRRARPEATVLLAACLTMGFMALRRYQLMNIYWSFAIVSVAAAWAFQEFGEGAPGPLARKAARVVAWAVVALSLLFGALYINMLAKMPEIAISTPAGSIRNRGWQASEAEELSKLIRAISEGTGEREPVFCCGYVPLVNFLIRRENPTRYSVIIRPGYTTDRQVDEIIATLERKKAPWVLSTEKLPEDDPLTIYLRANYNPVWRTRSYVLAARGRGAPAGVGP